MTFFFTAYYILYSRMIYYFRVVKMIFIFIFTAVSAILDSLDDIHCLQDPIPQDMDLIQSILEDRQLHALLEVRYIKIIILLFFSP